MIDTRIALVLPWFSGTAFFIFMLVQFFRGIPRELDEAAKIDGYGKIQILFRILVPVVKPALMTASIFAMSLLPTLVIFIIFQRYLVEGIAMDGIKG